MHRLIAAYRNLPSPSNRAKIEAYARKHPMAACILTVEEAAFLAAHGIRV